MGSMNLEHKISNWLSDYLKKNNLDSFIVGISGGIDSAVTSTLCAMTGYKTYLLVMPIHQKQDETDRCCLLYKSPSPRELSTYRMPSSD